MRRQPQALTEQEFDVVVIGGGIVGACVARDAATRGFSVALVEKGDFSSGTSAASSKMIHGGVRYLAQLQLSVVRESLRERRIWQRIAPHLVHPLEFVLPVTGLRERTKFSIGLSLFDLLSWDRGKLEDPAQRLHAHRWWSASETLEHIPLLRDSQVSGAICYADCQAYSPERLCLECLIDAAAAGAEVANYVECTGITGTADHVTGITAVDVMTNEMLAIRSKSVVNATGPWADALLALVEGSSHPARLMRSKGAHIIVRPLSPDYALTLRHGGHHAFVIPWRGHSLIGTTDTPFHDDPDAVSPSSDDVRSLLDIVNAGMPAAALTPADVRYAYAGIRPLVNDGQQQSYTMSRRAEIVDHGRSGGLRGLVSALGGKWTTARWVAEQCVDAVTATLGATRRPCLTGERPLPGGDLGTLAEFRSRVQQEKHALESGVIDQLTILYGSRYRDVIEVAGGDAALLQPLAPGVPDIGAQVLHAVRNEQAQHLLDVLLRRTGIGTLGEPSSAVLDHLLALMSAELRWSAVDVARERQSVASYYDHAVAAVTSRRTRSP